MTATMDDFAPTLVRASAGTGKTYQLTARLLRILLAGAPPESVLATTFTRKAAGEILDRVLLTLGQAAIDPTGQKLAELRRQVGVEDLDSDRCGRLFHTLLKNIHRLRICTLDSLFSQLARVLPFELALPPGWRLTDEVEEMWMRQTAVGNLIDSLQTAETETLISMLGRGDIKRNVALELIQVIENVYGLSRGSDADVWDTIDVPTGPASPVITSTAGQFRSSILPQKSLVAQLQNLADCLDARDFRSLVDQTILTNIHKARQDGDVVKYGRAKFPTDLDDAFDVVYEAVRVEALSLLRAQNHATASVVQHYDGFIDLLKQQQRGFSFDDIAARLADVFSGFQSDTLTERLDASIDHLLLDEFQDTSPVQWQVLRLLAQAVTGDASAPSKTFFCVGDTKQAIYGWRGGVAEIFDAVDRQIEGVRSVEQNESFRSSAVVLDAVSDAFANLHRHPMADHDADPPSTRARYESLALRQFAQRFPRHTAAKTLTGHVKFWTSAAAEVPDGVKPTAADATGALVRSACEAIAGLHFDAPEISIGVLTRTNATAAILIDELERRRVDVSGEGGMPLTDSVAVRWILSSLKMVEHPGDGRWEFHVRHSPLWDAIASMRANPDSPPADGLRSRLETDGLPETILTLVLSMLDRVDESERQRLIQLVELTTSHGHVAASRLRDFVETVEVKRVQRPKAAAVRVMTVHQSKGLEFDAVFLPEIHKPLLGRSPQCVARRPDPHQRPIGMSRHLGEKQWHFLPPPWQSAMGGEVAGRITESMCLLYVAMTRARRGLYLITPPANKPAMDVKTAAAMLFHAWQCDADPTEPNATLFESGDSRWWAGG